MRLRPTPPTTEAVIPAKAPVESVIPAKARTRTVIPAKARTTPVIPAEAGIHGSGTQLAAPVDHPATVRRTT